MTAHDPLCLAHPHAVAKGDAPCICQRLKTARLQGPVSDHGHAAICWCPDCMKALVSS